MFQILNGLLMPLHSGHITKTPITYGSKELPSVSVNAIQYDNQIILRANQRRMAELS